VFLLREDVASWEDALREPEELDHYEPNAASGVIGLLVVQPRRSKQPAWTQYLAPYIRRATGLDSLFNSSTGALLLIEAAGRRFAVSFGQGRHLLALDSYEHDFGLKVVLNVVDADRLKSVDARTVDDLTIHTRRDVSRESSLDAFGLDVSRDLVRAVTGQPRDPTLAHRLTGSEALAVQTRAQVPEIPALCGRLLEAYGSDEYKERFAWIDHLRKVRDRSLIESLDDLLLGDLRERQLDDLHLAPPQTIDWAHLAGFKFSTQRSEAELDTDPRISVYLNTLRDPENLDLARLKRERVEAIGAEGDTVLEQWSVYRCLVYERELDSKLYALTGGDWYGIDASFAEQTISFVKGLPDLDLDMPDTAIGTNEDDYNRGAADATGALCLDRQLVRLPGRDPIELCDLLTTDRQLVHVKKRGGSSTLSHLFAQGLVSAELLGDDEFRTAALAVVHGLDSSFDAVIPTDRPQRDEYEVGYVVISRSTSRDSPLTLPFFSLVNLASTARRLLALGFRVGVKKVTEA
jgi:uncharacterized protein (TIGR04141 family)